jgi:hypothetical protein
MNEQNQFIERINSATKNKHIIIPKKLKVQLVNELGSPIHKKNVLCHLNIYIDSSSYYTFSFIPTNSNGTIQLSRKDIIENTELKHSFNNNIAIDKSPVKYELFVMEHSMINTILNSMNQYLSQDIQAVKEDLKRRGLNEQQIALEIPKIQRKLDEDRKLYQVLKESSNGEIEYSQANSKLSGFWSSVSEIQANLIVKM